MLAFFRALKGAQQLSGNGKCFEVYYRSFRAASEGFHFYCLAAGGGIIAPHCTGGSRGWRLAAAEGPIDYWPGVKFYSACFSCLCQILYYPERWDVTASHQRVEKKSLQFWCLIIVPFSLSLLLLWLKKKTMSTPLGSCFFFVLIRNLSSSSFPINILKSCHCSLNLTTVQC